MRTFLYSLIGRKPYLQPVGRNIKVVYLRPEKAKGPKSYRAPWISRAWLRKVCQPLMLRLLRLYGLGGQVTMMNMYQTRRDRVWFPEIVFKYKSQVYIQHSNGGGQPGHYIEK